MAKSLSILVVLLSLGCTTIKKENSHNSVLNKAKMICGLGYSIENKSVTTSIEKMIDDKKLEQSFRKQLKNNYDSCIKSQVSKIE